MNIFAFDSSGKTASVCVVQQERLVYQKLLDRGLTHSETLLPLIQEAFAATALSPGQVGRYAVTAGPGSFTGLRIGLAMAKGLALPFHTPLVPVSTLQAYAEACGLLGTVICSLDARRSEVYWAAFKLTESGCTRLTPDAAAPAAQVCQWLSGQTEPVFFIGGGTEICYNVCSPALLPLFGPSPSGIIPARGAALAALHSEGIEAALAQPVYLRLSQAERERAARLQTKLPQYPIKGEISFE
ncbi:MAG: tRNA (adenosine(37)-N6)-threonylcarbamoyltransferase complex dimerization subunit type 1 TsaB [Oscillospiraceae bacterium]